MDQSTTFAIALGFIVVLAGMMWRGGATDGGRYWAAGWFCLYGSGACAALATRAPIFGPLYPALGTAFAALLYAGVRRFLGRDVQPRLAVAGVLVAAVRGVAQPFVSEAATQAIGMLVVSASVLACMYELGRKAEEVQLEVWGRALRASLPVLVVVSGIYAYHRGLGDSSAAALTSWLFGGLLVFVVQAVALHERRAGNATRELSTLEALLSTIPVGLVFSDNDGTIRTMNDGFARLSDSLDSRVWIGRNFSELANQVSTLLHEGEATEVSLHVTEKSIRREARMVARDFHYRDGRVAHASVNYVRDKKGDAIGRLWAPRDITNETQLQEQLERARQLETLGRLAAASPTTSITS